MPKWSAPDPKKQDLHDDEAASDVYSDNVDDSVLPKTCPGFSSLDWFYPPCCRSQYLYKEEDIRKTYVSRLYIIKKQALTIQIVVTCICSTTTASFDPKILSGRFSGVTTSSGSLGSRELVGMFSKSLTPTITIV